MSIPNQASIPLNEVAQAMVAYCVGLGCEVIGETSDEVSLTCPNPNCTSHAKARGAGHRSFDINRDNAKFYCFHCGLAGQGLTGPKGLTTLLGDGSFSLSAIRTVPIRRALEEPKKETPLSPLMTHEDVVKIQISPFPQEAIDYLEKRKISHWTYFNPELDIFVIGEGTQLPGMKRPVTATTIVFPTLDRKRAVTFYVYYVLGVGKYNSTGHKPLYITPQKPEEALVVVEGVFDALSVYTAGYQAVALLGRTFTANNDLSIFRGRIVVVMLDNDHEGRIAIKPVVKKLAGVASEVRIAFIHPKKWGKGIKDPNDVLVAAGEKALKEIIESAVQAIPKTETKVDTAQATEQLKEAEPEKQEIGVTLAPPSAQTEETAGAQEPQPETISARTESSTLRQGETRDATPEAPDVILTQPAPEALWTGEIAPELQSAQPVKEESGIIAEEEKEAYESQAPMKFPSATPRLAIPEICWRGIFKSFREAQAGTTEAPDEFFFGSLLASAGAILGRSCFIQLGQRLYPNLYVALVGETAKSRKTTAARKATDLVESTDPLVSRAFGLSTAEGLMLMFQESEAEAPVAPTWEGQRVLVWIDEFSGLLKKARTDFCAPLIEMLQRFYDNPDRVEIRTKIAPMTARKPSSSILTATTREKLTRYLTREDIEGGFANRFSFFVGQRKPPIPRPTKPDEQHLTNAVIMVLHKARERWKHTEFTFDADAAHVWDDFYNGEYYDVGEDEAILELTNRLTDQTAKLALIYAATENDEPVIHRDQIEASVAWATEYEKLVVKNLFAEYGMSEQVKLENRIAEIARNGGITRRDIQQRLHHVPAKQFNDTLNNMIKSGRMITSEQTQTRTDGRKYTQTFHCSSW